MSTVNKTTQTNAYNAGSMSTFNNFQPTIQSGLNDYASDPMKATYFNNQLQMGNRTNQILGNNQNQQTLWNLKASGNLNNPGAFLNSELDKNSRANMARTGDTFNNLLLNANQVRMNALNSMQNYKPLQTGQTQTQTQSGLGTWLPQVAGMGIKAATAFATGGMSGVAGGQGISNAFLQGQAGMNGMNPAMSTYQPYNQTLQGPN